MHQQALEYCSGPVERVTFHSEESGFCVLKIKAKGQKDLVTVTGKVAAINAGEFVESGGNWINDKNYGLQFKAVWLKIIQPTTLEGIEKYLGSGLIKGIGPVFAKKLVKGFGDQIFDVIDQEPNKLLSLDGIGPKRIAKITSAWSEQKAIREIMVFLQSNGIGTARAVRIYKTYQDDAITIIKDNPYRLAIDIRGIGFKTADQLAEKLGIDKQSVKRARAGILHVIQEIASEGHCATLETTLIKKSVELLEIEENIIAQAICLETKEEHLISDHIDNQKVLYIDKLYYAEIGVCTQIVRLNKEKTPVWGKIDTDKALSWVKNKTGVSLSKSQTCAVNDAANHKISCITGGPGVGKTTVLNSIIKIVQAKKAKVTLCAPTGRAAKRLSESTQMEAKTIHRLLEFDPSSFSFSHNEDNPIQTDLLVVDEASMIDISLMNSLLKALPDRSAILIVGDIDQLPSVGPGSVLADIINSEYIKVVRLTEIFRQAAHSQIIVNAHRINSGLSPIKSEPGTQSDFFIIHANDAEDIYAKLTTVITQRLPQVFSVDPIKDVQILTPMNRGGLGVKSLNIELQKLLNPSPVESITKFGWQFGVGDKVIQTSNNYDKDVFNGDLGTIIQVDHIENEVTALFDDKKVVYDFGELDELDLAYAISIHKSQGSEYPVVIIPLAMQHYMMLQRNLFYTGVTRGKKLVIVIGEPKAIAMAAKNIKQSRRITKLAGRLKEALDSPQPQSVH